MKKLLFAAVFLQISIFAAWTPSKAVALPHPLLKGGTSSRTGLPKAIAQSSPTTSTSSVSDLVSPRTISASTPANLSLDMKEDVFLPNEGNDAPFTIVITAPAGTMAQVYRLMFGITQQIGVGVPIPLQNSPSSGETKSEFYESMEKQQLVSLGLVVNFSQSNLIPRTNLNDFQVLLKGSASFPGLNLTQDASGTVWHIPIGLRGNNSTEKVVQYVFENMVFAKWMLESFPGSQRYQLKSRTAFHLPLNANLESGFSIGMLNWMIDMGGGNSLTARLSPDKDSTILLEEVTSVTEDEINTAPDDILNALSNFKIFDIDYTLAQSPQFGPIDPLVSVDNDFSKDFGFSTSPNVPPVRFEKTIGDNTANATIKVDITTALHLGISAHIDADIGVVGCGYFCVKITTKSFHTWFQMEASATSTLHAVATGEVNCCEEEELFDPPMKLTTFSFSIGPVPVWMDLNLGARAELNVTAHGILILDASVQMTEKFKAGLQWTRENGWQTIAENHFDINTKGPTVSGNAAIHIDAGLPLRLELLVYSALGPEVSFRPYLTADAFVSGSASPASAGLEGNWTVKVGFKVLVGMSFAPKLAKLLGLKDSIKDREIFDQVLKEWSGSFKLGTPPFSAKTSSTTKNALTSDFISASSSIPMSGSVIGPAGTGFAGADIDITLYGEVLACFARSPNPEENPAYCVYRDLASGTECTVPPLETTGPCAGTFNASHWVCFNSYPNSRTGEPACGPIQLPLGQWHTTSDSSGNYVQEITSPQDTGRYFVDILVSYAGLADFADEDFIAFTVKPADYTAPLVDAMIILLNLSENATDPSSVVFKQNSTLIPSQRWYTGNVTVIWEVSDNESGISSTTGCQTVTLTEDTPGTTMSCSALNGAGLTNTTSVTIRIDNTPPVVEPIMTPAPNAEGWNTGDVTLSWAVADPESGVTFSESCEVTYIFPPTCEAASQEPPPPGIGCNPITRKTETFETSFACLAVNAAGLATEVQAAVRIDKTPPVIVGIRTPEANPNGWNNGPVTVNFLCTDRLSGVDTFSSPTLLKSEGSGQMASGNCRDNAGNSASTLVGRINIDMTPPTITGSTSPGPNSNGWNNGPVTVAFSCSDTVSGLSSCSSPMVLTGEGAGQSATGTATDLAGNSFSFVVRGINIDLTPPIITSSRSPGPNAIGWNSGDVNVTFTCSDSISGVGVQPVSPQRISTEGSGQTASAKCFDRAGNPSSSIVGGINIDKTPPTIISTDEGASFVLHQLIYASFSCSDNLSGLASCGQHCLPGLCSASTRFLLDSSTVGDHTYTIDAFDNAGNAMSKIIHYHVIYQFQWLFPTYGTVVGANSTVQVKFTLTDALGNAVNATKPPKIWVDCPPQPFSNCLVLNPGMSPRCSHHFTAICSNNITYDPTKGLFTFRLSTFGLPIGDHTVWVTLDDGRAYPTKFTI